MVGGSQLPNFSLEPVPDPPVIYADDIVATVSTISLSWTLPPNVTESEVSWAPSHTVRGAVHSANEGSGRQITRENGSYIINGLKGGTSYDITVTVFNSAGNSSTAFSYSTLVKG